jgi:RHS repeat-associated protein
MRFFSLFLLFIFAFAGTASAQSLTDKTPISDIVSGNNFNAARVVSVDVDPSTGKTVYVFNELDASGTTRDVWCAVYDDNHNRLVNNFRVNNSASSEQLYPTVKIHQEDNSFMVAWQSNHNSGNGYDIYMKKISLDVTNSTSSSVTSASDILVNDITSADQTQPRLVIDYSRYELIVGFSSASSGNCYAKRFTYSTLSPPAGQFILASTPMTLGDINISSVTGELIAVYPVTTGPSVYKRIFTYSSGWQGQTPVMVNASTSGQVNIDPFLSVNQKTGAYSIGWRNINQSNGANTALAKIYSSTHTVLKSEFSVNSSTGNSKWNVKAVWDEATNYIIYFYDHTQSGFSTIRYRIMNDQYNFIGNEQSALLTDGSENNTYYTTAGGNYSLAYDQQSRKITLAYDLYNNFTAYSKACIRVFEYSNPGSQPPTNCSTDATMLWMEETTYDEYGNIVAQSRSYSDILGRTTQVQSRNIAENKILAAQVLYDKQGRAVLQTLPAPITQTCFTYNINFIAAPSYCGPDASYPNCAPYTNADFDLAWNSGASGEINNPKAIGKSTSALGTYYSTLNTAEPYVPESSYPYSRIDYNDRVVGGQIRSSGPGESLRMGQGHEAKSIVLPLLTELDANYLPIRNTLTGGSATTLAGQGTKTISTDQNGKETVTFRDKSGRVLAKALSNGTTMTATTTPLAPQISWYNFTLPSGVSISNMNVTCSADIEILDGNSNGLTSTLYSGAAGAFTTTYNGSGSGMPPFRVIQVRSSQPFTVSVTYGNIYNFFKASSSDLSSRDLDIYVKNGGITVNSSYSSFKIYDLVKGGLISGTNTYASTFTGTISLSDGPYRLRITGSLPAAALDYTSNTNALSISHSFNYSEWSYFYYDDAGRVLREISPKGVDLGSTSVPTKFYSQNTYNTLGWTLSSYDSDRGLTEYVYQKDGQLRFSQDARQKAQNKFSYINYNSNGDITEQGEYASVSISGSLWFQNTIDIANGASLKDNNNNAVTGTSIGTIIESADGVDDARCSSVNKILMHVPDNTGLAAAISGYTQRYVSGRISKSYTGDNSSTSWYSYDEQGRMEWMVQNITGLGVKTIHYEYGLLGNLKKTIYQKGTSAERFEHRYDYDANARLSNVKTKAGLGFIQQEALYKYYTHGPLKRTELATDLQGIDYVYTINGMLKSINHPTLDNTKDPGKDSYTGTNSAFAPDVFGMQLQYFDGDYTRTSSNITNTTLTGYQDQFSGAIKGMKWQVKGHGMGGSSQDMLMYGFTYDQKYQLTNADFGTVTAASEATFTASTAFSVANTYDINGNLLSKLRKNGSGNANHDFTYAYGSTPANNMLNTLTGTGTVSKTFVYDEAGKITRETTGGNTVRSMTYNPYDLLTEVKTYNATLGYDVTQEKSYYNERGQRIKKEVYTTLGVLYVTTWYVRDAAGSIMSVYDNSSGSMIQTELPIYGNGKIGQARKTASAIAYTYELTDHLGTVRATINREKSSGVAAIETWADYYADGEVMPGRNGTSSLTTRYGYQGQFAEVNEATGFIDFDLRNYDITIGRWIQPDPYAQHWSPYTGMGNDPVSRIDPDGGFDYAASCGRNFGGGYAPPPGATTNAGSIGAAINGGARPDDYSATGGEDATGNEGTESEDGLGNSNEGSDLIDDMLADSPNLSGSSGYGMGKKGGKGKGRRGSTNTVKSKHGKAGKPGKSKLGGNMDKIINAHRDIMEQVYPGGDHDPSNKHPFCKDPKYVQLDQCAIRVSGAIRKAGVVDNDYKFSWRGSDNVCKDGDERDAGTLWLWVEENSKGSGIYREYGSNFETTDDYNNFLTKQSGRKGFVYLYNENTKKPVHIDTFDGSKFTDKAYAGPGYRIYFMEIK